MIRGKPLTAIIPARGGSKGIPGKNLRRLGKDTLLERAIKLGQRSKHVDRVIVSTDDPEMHEIAKRYGTAAPNLRPAELATDEATTGDAVRHLIGEADIADGYLLVLQPTSPLRRLADLDELCEVYEASGADAIVSLCLHEEPHPAKMSRITNGHVRPFMENTHEGPRQTLEEVYAFNGAFYLVASDVFLKTGSFLPPATIPFIMPPERSANLDTMTDWHIVQALVGKGVWEIEELD